MRATRSLIPPVLLIGGPAFRVSRGLAACALAVWLTACGGGGGNDPAPPGGNPNPLGGGTNTGGGGSMTYAIGGTVSGLAGGTLVLQINGGFDLTVSADGGFVFSLRLADQSAYSVQVSSQPVGQACTVANSAGVISGADVTTIAVQCAATTQEATNTVFVDPSDVVLDSANSRLLVSDGGRSTIFAIDLASGARSIFYQSSEIVQSVREPFFNPVSIDLDVANNRLFVGTNSNLRRGIFALALNNAARTTLVDQDSPNGLDDFPIATITVDGLRSRVLAGGHRHDQIIAVSYTGVRMTLSDDTTPNAANPLNGVSALVMDTVNDRLIASNDSFAGIYAIDPATGARSVFSQQGSVDALALDTTHNRLLASFNPGVVAAHAVQTVPLAGGARGTLSGDGVPDMNALMIRPAGLALDAANNRVFVTDTGLNKVLAVDLVTGKRTVFSESVVPNGDFPFASFMEKSIAVDTVNNRLLVARSSTGASDHRMTLAVDLTTGQRSHAFAADLTHMVFDAANQRVIGVDVGSGIIGGNLVGGNTFAVDVASGVSTMISSSALQGFALDAGRNRLVGLINTQSIGVIDLSNGQQTVLADLTTPGSGVAFGQLEEVVYDAANDRYLASDVSHNVIFAIDPATGARSVFVDAQAQMTYSHRIALDAARNRLLLLEDDTLWGYDLTTRAVTIVSDNATPNLANRFVAPGDMAIDVARNRALIVDEAWGGILAVDLVTGVRSVLSVGMER